MIKRVRIFLLLLVLVVPVTAFAAENRGSIGLTMRYSGRTVPGGAVTLYCVTDLEDTTDPERMAAEVLNWELPGTVREVGSDGYVEFSDLSPGQYLLVQLEAANGFLPMKPFCVSLPMWLEETLTYQIDAAPKLEPVPGEKLPQTGLLIWPAWVLLGTGALLVGIGAFARKRE